MSYLLIYIGHLHPLCSTSFLETEFKTAPTMFIDVYMSS